MTVWLVAGLVVLLVAVFLIGLALDVLVIVGA